MSQTENKIKNLNIKLPEPKAPVGAYVATKIVGKLLYAVSYTHLTLPTIVCV